MTEGTTLIFVTVWQGCFVSCTQRFLVESQLYLEDGVCYMINLLYHMGLLSHPCELVGMWHEGPFACWVPFKEGGLDFILLVIYLKMPVSGETPNTLQSLCCVRILSQSDSGCSFAVYGAWLPNLWTRKEQAGSGLPNIVYNAVINLDPFIEHYALQSPPQLYYFGGESVAFSVSP